MTLKHAAIALAVISGLLLLGVARGSWVAVNRAIALQDAANSVTAYVSLIKDIETASRGYVISGDDVFLKPWYMFNSQNVIAQSKLRMTGEKVQADSALITKLLTLVQAKIDFTRDVIDVRKQSLDQATVKVSSGEGKVVMDQLRELSDRYVTELNAETNGQWSVIKTRYIPWGAAALMGFAASLIALLYALSGERRATVAAQNLMQQVMSASPVGLALTSDGRRIASANRAFLDLFASSENGSARNLPDEIQAIFESENTVDNVSHDIVVEYNDNKRFVKLSTFPVKITNPEGRILDGTGIAAVDLTAEKALEQSLEASKDEAEAANRAKSTFLANMSHELRTPLTSIIGYCELLQEETEELGNASLDSDLDNINRSAKHLLALINDVLDLSKIEAQKMDVHPIVFDLDAFLADIVATSGSLVSKNHNTFDVSSEVGPLQLETDDLKLKQALLNIVGNAAKFTTDGSIKLRVVRDAIAPDDQISFVLNDTGIGMTDAQMQNLFTRFNQADATTTRKYGGTGLGLALTKSLVNILGGTISVRSGVGIGSEFRLTVPTHYTRILEGPNTGIENKTVVSEELNTDHPLLLIVDDQPEARDILNRHLQKSGFRTKSVASGAEALAMIRTENPIAVLLDVMMPGLDGWHVLRAIRDNPDTKNIPVIMQTVVDDKQFAYAMGADGFLKKPINRDDLYATLANATGGVAPATVLVVDSSNDASEIIRRQVKGSQFSVSRVSDGRKAIARLNRAATPPALILVNATLPDMSGFELVRKLRDLPHLGNTSVHLLTSARVNSDTAAILKKDAMVIPHTERAIKQLVEDLKTMAQHKKGSANNDTHSAG